MRIRPPRSDLPSVVLGVLGVLLVEVRILFGGGSHLENGDEQPKNWDLKVFESTYSAESNVT